MTEISESIKGKVDGIRNVTVLGAGTMGSGISRLFSSLGYNVRVVEPFEKNLKKTSAVAKIKEDNLFDSLTKEAVDDTDLVIEAVTENPQLKKEQVYDVMAKFFDEGEEEKDWCPTFDATPKWRDQWVLFDENKISKKAKKRRLLKRIAKKKIEWRKKTLLPFRLLVDDLMECKPESFWLEKLKEDDDEAVH